MSVEPTDVELLRRARTDAEAFRIFYRRYAPPLSRWLEHQLGDSDVALDITAETFARALAGIGRFRPATGDSAAPWLYGIAANLMRRYWGRRSVETRYRERLGILEQTAYAHFSDADAIDRMDAARGGERMREALAALPPAIRDAVRLRVLDDLSYAEAAIVLGTSEATARVRVHRGLRALRLAVQHKEER